MLGTKIYVEICLNDLILVCQNLQISHWTSWTHIQLIKDKVTGDTKCPFLAILDIHLVASRRVIYTDEWQAEQYIQERNAM